ncbi:hypothetical protein LEP1GSC041_1941 [Leptospira noguchii str. 2006001870]|uniref:Acetyltransferase (GNAT) domain protein n=1 Tax=Leptospira noguchii serovar Autumnalis str. ZUN142 TaxID=1085540 RepID=M6UJR1_9LEPT|nr:hypothetical protein LEP1GSC041_1941 [Leptospira noguchii str. 2006001870]EMI64557.1 hypothetical protein LEP1GSC072_2868 [Leptospira noguchii str. Bonito]EMO43011.1 hypothetical protein LEP1GSC186_2486 [Leptospira noguchii serovar Autumnalis str. ZUN142]
MSYVKASSWRFPTLYKENYFAWKIQKNPFGNSFCYLRYVDKIAAAHSSITAKPLNPDLGFGTACAELGDTHTHPNFQNQGHFGAVGLQVIQEFDAAQKNEAVIFGIPNENAVRGWQTRCNCELLDSLNVSEFFLNKRLNFPFGKTSTLQKINSPNEIKKCINEIWLKTYKSKRSLYKKDSNWWEWRYNQCPEKYDFFALFSKEGVLKSYLIAKFTRNFIFSHIDICDIVGIDEDSELVIFDNFLNKFRKSFSKTRVWAKQDSRLHSVLLDAGFNLNRKINFVIYKNKVLQNFTNNKINFELALGDTDNA